MGPTTLTEAKREIIVDILGQVRSFRFCGPSDDPDEQTAVTAGYRDLVIQLQRLLGPFLPGDIATRLNAINVEINDLSSAYDANSEICALLPDLESTLEVLDKATKGVYDPGDEYAFYRDLSSVVQTVKHDILIVDAYLDEQVFNLYVSKVPNGAIVRILSNKIGINVATVARMYARSRPLELRSSTTIHDRHIFLDQRGWIVGQSIKDAARKKPTYMIELNEPSLTAAREAHERIWAAATVIIS